MTPADLRELREAATRPEGKCSREEFDRYLDADERFTALAPALAQALEEAWEALEWALDVHELTLRRLDELDPEPSSDPEHMRIREAGMAKARAVLAKLERLGA